MATEHVRCESPRGRRIAVAMGVEIHQLYEELEARWDGTRDPRLKQQLQAMDGAWHAAYHEENNRHAN